MTPPPYDATVARIAGNILSGGLFPSFVPQVPLVDRDKQCVQWAVALARAVLAECQRTEPPQGVD